MQDSKSISELAAKMAGEREFDERTAVGAKVVAAQQLARLQHELSLMKANKPNNRSEMDRAWAVTITEFEKMIAYFRVYVVGG
jgi:hypothetical protein